jgi:hypothetical protein
MRCAIRFKNEIFVPFLLALLLGCGTSSDFATGNRLRVTSITDMDGASTLVLHVGDGTDTTAFQDFYGKVLILNEPRLGVEEGVDLHVYRIDMTYLDARNTQSALAPKKSYGIASSVPTNSSVELNLVFVPSEMVAEVAPRLATDFWLREWTIVIDIWAEDARNGNSVQAQGSMTVRFN